MAWELGGMQGGRGSRPEEALEAELRLQMENLGGSPLGGAHPQPPPTPPSCRGSPAPTITLALLAHM